MDCLPLHQSCYYPFVFVFLFWHLQNKTQDVMKSSCTQINCQIESKKKKKVRFTLELVICRKKFIWVLQLINVQSWFQIKRRLAVKDIAWSVKTTFSNNALCCKHQGCKFYLVVGFKENRARLRPKPGLRT